MATARERSHSDVQEQTVVNRCSTGDITEEQSPPNLEYICSPLQTWNTFCPILVGLYSESESHPVVSVSGDPMDCTVHGILQARILQQVAFPFSRLSSQSRD